MKIQGFSFRLEHEIGIGGKDHFCKDQKLFLLHWVSCLDYPSNVGVVAMELNSIFLNNITVVYWEGKICNTM